MRIGQRLVITHTMLAVIAFFAAWLMLRSTSALIIAFIVCGALFLVAGTSYVLSKSITAPLKQMMVMTDRMANDDLEQRLPAKQGDEIGGLSKSLNELAEKLNERFDRLKTEKAKADLILENMAEGILLLNERGEVVLTNPPVEQIFGVTGNEIFGKPVTYSIQSHELDRAIQESSMNHREVVDEIIMQSPFKQLRIRIMPITNSPGEDQTLVVIRDITRQEQVERLRKDFVANVSHELKTPLTGLKLISDTLLRSIDTDPASSRIFIKRLDKELSTLISLVRELIDLSKLESPQETAGNALVDMGEIVTEVCESFLQLAATGSLSLTHNIEEGVAHVFGDREQLFTLARNLVDNAIRYTPARGKISVNLDMFDGMVRLAVADNGIGLAKREIPRIFERFYRVDKARSRETGGTGLGLSLVKHIAENHNATVDVESALGIGSTFIVSFPVDRRPFA